MSEDEVPQIAGAPLQRVLDWNGFFSNWNEGRLNSRIFSREDQWPTVPKGQVSQEPKAIPAPASALSDRTHSRKTLTQQASTDAGSRVHQQPQRKQAMNQETEPGLETSWNVHLRDPPRRKNYQQWRSTIHPRGRVADTPHSSGKNSTQSRA